MNTVSMSFRPTEALKDWIEFIAKHEGKSLNQVIISELSTSIQEKKEMIKRELYFHQRALAVCKAYEETGIAYTLNDF